MLTKLSYFWRIYFNSTYLIKLIFIFIFFQGTYICMIYSKKSKFLQEFLNKMSIVLAYHLLIILRFYWQCVISNKLFKSYNISNK